MAAKKSIKTPFDTSKMKTRAEKSKSKAESQAKSRAKKYGTVVSGGAKSSYQTGGGLNSRTNVTKSEFVVYSNKGTGKGTTGKRGVYTETKMDRELKRDKRKSSFKRGR